MIALKVIFWPIILLLFIINVYLLEQWRNFTVTVIDCYIFSYLFFFPHRWVWPLVGIIYYIRITFLSDHISAIYHHCFSPITIASFHRHRCWFLYFLMIIFSLRTFVGMSDYIISIFMIDHIIAILLYIIIPLIGWIV